MTHDKELIPGSPGRAAPIGWTVLGLLSLIAVAGLGIAWGLREYRGRARASVADSPRLRLDINSASADELELLPGIGPGRAAKIVAARRKRGGFRRLEELDERGLLGPGSAERLAPYLQPVRTPSPEANDSKSGG